jgi:hypothetical protein
VRAIDVGVARLLIPDVGTLDWPALAIATGSVVAMLRFGIGMFATLGVAGVAGVVLGALD